VSRLWVVALVVWPGLAWAHGFQVEARWAGGQILVEAHFDHGDPPGAGEVVVRRGDDVLAKGVLGAGGSFAWTPPGPGRYRFEVTEPGLHTAFAELLVRPEMLSAGGTTSAVSSGTRPSPAPAAEPPSPRGSMLGRALLGLAVIAVLAWLLWGLQGTGDA
jgi:hypothetical protein